ncbi:MAG TPA: acetyl-CoA carboxylase biotin carboxylase subunit [Bdellovibrionales bacterium]|nr:acetyl-CoA carboxylase biotin carboxylase subunit [Bdellovibrionales bacterium]
MVKKSNKFFKKVLIANRGEIAIRVTRACRDLGIQAAVVYSDADRNSLHVALADEAYYVGPAPSRESYLNIPKILNAIKQSKAEAVHPGYGFLSERANFAREVAKLGVEFIGPSPESMELMGDKLQARDAMKKAGVPIVPGSDGAVRTIDEVNAVIKKIGYPVMMKAAAGGGGKGMRIIRKPEELEGAFRSARSEALNYFSDDTVYLERFISNPKHIEIQVFGDKHGNVVHLFERECSVQRRHQKIIEESPSPSVPDNVRKQMGEIAVKAAKAIGYVGAGTFEFIFDAQTKEFYFMEMNTRLQVEHPVTEMVTGVDLVQEQLSVAAGNPLSFKQEDLKQRGFAIEARICAEDPATFMPSPGKIRRCRHPQGPFIRLDSCAYPSYEVPIHYDPMIAKLIAWGSTREQAIIRLDRALAEFSLTGIKTNIQLHRNILEHPQFIDGSYTTQFIEKEFPPDKNLFKYLDDRVFLITAAIEAYNDRKSQGVWDINVQSRWKNTVRSFQR